MRGRSIGEDSLAVFDEETLVVRGCSESECFLGLILGRERELADKGAKYVESEQPLFARSQQYAPW